MKFKLNRKINNSVNEDYVNYNANPQDRNEGKLQGISELDVYVPPCDEFPNGFGIEYNGEYYHIGREQRDEAKREGCRNLNIPLVVITGTTENGEHNALTEHNENNYTWYSASYYYKNDNLLKTIIENICSKLFHSPVDIDLRRDNSDILNLVKSKKVENSVAFTKASQMLDWNYSKNAINPLSVPYSDLTCKVYLKCHICGNELYTTDGESYFYKGIQRCTCNRSGGPNNTKPIKIYCRELNKTFKDFKAAIKFLQSNYPEYNWSIGSLMDTVNHRNNKSSTHGMHFEYDQKSLDDYKLKHSMHELWSDDDENQCLEMQDKFFSDEITLEQFETFLETKRNNIRKQAQNNS